MLTAKLPSLKDKIANTVVLQESVPKTEEDPTTEEKKVKKVVERKKRK